VPCPGRAVRDDPRGAGDVGNRRPGRRSGSWEGTWAREAAEPPPPERSRWTSSPVRVRRDERACARASATGAHDPQPPRLLGVWFFPTRFEASWPPSRRTDHVHRHGGRGRSRAGGSCGSFWGENPGGAVNWLARALLDVRWDPATGQGAKPSSARRWCRSGCDALRAPAGDRGQPGAISPSSGSRGNRCGRSGATCSDQTAVSTWPMPSASWWRPMNWRSKRHSPPTGTTTAPRTRAHPLVRRLPDPREGPVPGAATRRGDPDPFHPFAFEGWFSGWTTRTSRRSPTTS